MGWFSWLFDRNRREREFDRELQFHIEQVTREYLARGMSREEAHRRAMVELGGKEQTAQKLRDVYVIGLVERARENLKAGFRLMRRAPGFAAAVILTLALGIGTNSGVFSAIDAVLLRPLPFPYSNQLLVMRQYEPRNKAPMDFVAPARLRDWRAMNSTFQSMSGYYTEDDSELSGEMPEKVTRAFVASGFLQVLGVAPALGRDFTAEEERYKGPDAVLISDRFWHRRFGGNRDALGKTVRFGAYSSTIVGVMPPRSPFRRVTSNCGHRWRSMLPRRRTANRHGTW